SEFLSLHIWPRRSPARCEGSRGLARRRVVCKRRLCRSRQSRDAARISCLRGALRESQSRRTLGAHLRSQRTPHGPVGSRGSRDRQSRTEAFGPGHLPPGRNQLQPGTVSLRHHHRKSCDSAGHLRHAALSRGYAVECERPRSLDSAWRHPSAPSCRCKSRPCPPCAAFSLRCSNFPVITGSRISKLENDVLRPTEL